MRRGHKRAHRIIWLILAAMLPAVLLAALTIRPIGPTETPQIRLAPPG